MFASLVSVRGRVLFVLAVGLAPWKCWLVAMTQRYSIREGRNERERESKRDGGGRGRSVWGSGAAAECVVYLKREGGAHVRIERRREQRRGGLTLVKVRDTCLLPPIVTQAATTLASS